MLINCTRPVPPSSTPMYVKNDDHDAFLYHQQKKANTNNNTAIISPSTTKPTPAATTTVKTIDYAPFIKIPINEMIRPLLPRWRLFAPLTHTPAPKNHCY